MVHISDEKASLRQAIEQRIQSLSSKNRDAESRSICRRILEQLPEHAVVCAYAALKTEVNLALLMETLTQQGERIFLPCYDGTLQFRKFEGWEHLQKGPFGIPEPSHQAPMLDPQEATVVLVPGRAFDRAGHRLGRGNGGYDLWIQQQRKANSAMQYWGIALDCQMVSHVPVESFDQQMDAIVTGREFIVIKQ